MRAATSEEVAAYYGLGMALFHHSELFGLHSLSQPERHFHAIQRLDADVHNGGFYSYFDHSAGDLAADALAGFRMIGAMCAHDLLQRAAKVFPNGVIPEPEDRWKLLGLRVDGGLLDDLDGEYYDSDEPLITLALAYAKRHAADFQVGEDIIASLG